MPRGRTIVFIDNSNAFRGQLSAGWRIDAKKLQAYLSREGEIWQTFFFAAASDPPRYQQTNFYHFLKNELRYEVIIYELGRRTIRCNECGSSWQTRVEKGVDVGLATKMLTLANNRAFDTAILVAADRDYLETVRAIKNNGLRVEIVAWRGSISPEMQGESSRPVIYFDDIRRDVEMTAAPDAEAEKLESGEEPASAGGGRA
jgi:uncharacterized LabA/DUF88 family protein